MSSMCCLCLSVSDASIICISAKCGDELTYLDKVSSSLYQLANVLNELNCNGYLICSKCRETIDMICCFNSTCLRNVKTYSTLNSKSSDVPQNNTDAVLVKSEILFDTSPNDQSSNNPITSEDFLVKQEVEDISNLSDSCQEIEDSGIKKECLNQFEMVFLENGHQNDFSEVSGKFFWQSKNTLLMLHEYKKRIDRFKDPAVKKKMLWEEISNAMLQNGYNVSSENLDRKMRNMKKTYKLIMDNLKDNMKKPRWEYFDIFESIIKYDSSVDDFSEETFFTQDNSTIIEPPTIIEPSSTSPVSEKFHWENKNTILLLNEYKKRIQKFRNPKIEKKALWEEISNVMSRHGYYISSENLDRKMRNMKKTYKFIVENKKNMKRSRWQYFEIYESIIKYDETVGDYMSEMFSTQDDSIDIEPTFSTSQINEKFHWENKNTLLLLDEYKKRVDKFKNPKIEKKTLWEEISLVMNQHGYYVDVDSIDRKIRNMKIRYRSILDNPNYKKGIKKPRWEYFDIFDDIFKYDNTFDDFTEEMYSTQDNSTDIIEVRPSTSKISKSFDWQSDSIQLMLDEYRKRIDKFRSPNFEKKSLWEEISVVLEQHGYYVDWDLIDRKMRNMKKTYKIILDNLYNRKDMKKPRWEYFEIFEEFFKNDFIGIFSTNTEAQDPQPSTSQDEISPEMAEAHIRLATIVENENEQQMLHKKASTKMKAHTCNVCNAKFIAKRNLEQHMYIHTGSKPNMCEICGKSYFESTKLIEHIRSHTGERPYVCDICGKTFPTKSNFDRHKMIHTGEKPYSCNTCDKRFRLSTDLQKHERTHTGEKPYVCTICNRAFKVSSVLIEHKRTHYRETFYTCDICGQSFTRKGSVKKHKLKQHKLKPKDV